MKSSLSQEVLWASALDHDRDNLHARVSKRVVELLSKEVQQKLSDQVFMPTFRRLANAGAIGQRINEVIGQRPRSQLEGDYE